MRKVFKKIFKILKKHKIFFLLSAIVLLSLFFYTYNLKATQAHLVDTARDILHALRLWKDKEITLIGPPVTTFQHPHHKIFFSSLSLYIALVGLIVTNFNVLGAIIPIIFLLLASIPLFYILTSFFTQNKIKRIIATVIYALSPVTVYYARFFWHPNFVIPLSILYWYLFLFAEKKMRKE